MTDMNNIPLARVMDTMAEGVFVLDASCLIILWNQAMTEMTGWGEDEMIGNTCTELVCPNDGQTQGAAEMQSDCALLKHVDGKNAVSQREGMLRTKDGRSIPVLKNGRILFDDKNVPTGVVVTLTDLRPLRKLEQDIAVMRHDSMPIHGIGRLVGGSSRMLDVYERIRLAGDSTVTVLIEGETGTGKELAAEAVHTMSSRRDKPLVKVNCSALSENLLESELFGHVKGAFTGAIKDKVGRIEMAEGGTLFLDEIGDISPLIQLKLLRVLQEHEYERVGESTPRKVDVRFIAATHRNLRARVAEGQLREDFYYRVRVFSIAVPPLRDHKEDIRLLCDTFIRGLNHRTGKHITRLSHDANHCLMDYCWPGNVRELENAMEHAFVICHADCIELDDLPLEIRSEQQRAIECQKLGGTVAPPPASAAPLTQERLLEVLEASGWNQSESARRLGVDRTTIWRKMKQWKITPPH